jgi:hypothetical protein
MNKDNALFLLRSNLRHLGKHAKTEKLFC